MKRQFQHLPKPKRFTPRNLANVDPLPVVSVNEEADKFVGIFTGLSVEVCDSDSIAKLSLGGCLGQGTESRSFPASVRDGKRDKVAPEIVRRRQFERRQEWRRKFGLSKEKFGKIKILEVDTEQQLTGDDSMTSDMVEELNPFPVQENSSLGLEEALFLARELKCLEVRTLDGIVLEEEQLLDKFSTIKSDFISSYIAYVYFKSKNWIVKSGLKFGGDFLLYQKGPQFFHASYIVVIQPYQNKGNLPGRTHYLDNFDFQCFNRIAETTAKNLLVLEVHYPRDVDPNDWRTSIDRLSDFEVSEVFPRHHNWAAFRMSGQVESK